MGSKTKRPFAVFDIDGTIIRWQLYHSLADSLIQTGYIKDSDAKIVIAAREKWQRREASYSFQDYEATLVPIMQKSLASVPAGIYKNLTSEVFQKNKDRIYTYTVNLIRNLQNRGYLIFLISGSMEILVKQIADYYKCDDFAGSKLTFEGKSVNGRDVIMTHNNKSDYLNMMVARHNTDFVDSIGVGDTDGDIEMLKLVQNPIAFNPNLDLFNFAKEHHWQIIVERKNVIYNLEYDDGNYQLGNPKF